LLDNKWELLYLGPVDWGRFFRTGVTATTVDLLVQYEKDAADTVRLDCLWLVPRTEPRMRLQHTAANSVPVGSFWVTGQTESFDYLGEESGVPAWAEAIMLVGKPMTLCPNVENRLYFTCETFDSPDTIWEAHAIAGAPPSVEMIVNIDYLPQYTSPLE